jgi:uncharacterized repeat protein (TIGR03917 family)
VSPDRDGEGAGAAVRPWGDGRLAVALHPGDAAGVLAAVLGGMPDRARFVEVFGDVEAVLVFGLPSGPSAAAERFLGRSA